MKTFAIADPLNLKRVVLWCETISIDENDIRTFYCINGAWEGTYKNGHLQVENTSTWARAEIVWEGYCPHTDYNDAIEWIETLLI